MKRVLVFCGSSPGIGHEYIAQAQQLGRLLAAQNLELVYGGAGRGLMGAVADSALAAGGTVIGVMPNDLAGREVAHDGLSELHLVDTTAERKALMAELSDVAIALPGGLGTLDELIEMLTWKQIGAHRHPLGVLDVAGYWQPLLKVFDHAIAHGFLAAGDVEELVVEEEAELLLERLAAQEPATN